MTTNRLPDNLKKFLKEYPLAATNLDEFVEVNKEVADQIAEEKEKVGSFNQTFWALSGGGFKEKVKAKTCLKDSKSYWFNCDGKYYVNERFKR